MASNNDSQPREQWAKQSDAHRTDFERAEKPTKYRIVAWALWILGIACAFGSALVASRVFYVPFLSDLPVLTVVLAVVVDLVAVLAAQRFWRRAAALAPAKKQGVVNVVMACLAFAPMCLFFLSAKNAEARTKGFAIGSAVVSVAALVACCLLFGNAPVDGAALP